jgi:superfamily II DNA/RNA helicase
VDFKKIATVIHAEFPRDAATYLHRVGRCARNESSGRSVAIITEPTALSTLISEAAQSNGQVKSQKLLNHHAFFKEAPSASGNTGEGDLTLQRPEIGEVTDGRKFPLTGLLSRKRSFSK